jgi:alanine racemase
VRTLVGDARLAAVVKSDGYGHGIEIAARTFTAVGADLLAVATLDEALVLRRAGIDAPIVILFAIPPNEVAIAANADVELVAAEVASVRALLAAWRSEQAHDATGPHELRIHLEVETGLARAGIQPEQAAEIARAISQTPRTRLAGIWSHLASSHDPQDSAAQRERFDTAIESLRSAGIAVPARHLAATGALFADAAPAFELVRVGLALYGLLPEPFPIASRAENVARGLRAALSLKARALRIESVTPGTPVGYSALWRANRPSMIATLPLGYGDGWVRAYAGNSSALVRGRRVPLIGSVAMDAVAADVTDVPRIGLDDEFVLIGEQRGERITAAELARSRNTISWEVVAGMSARLPRVYHAAAGLTGLRTLLGETLAEVKP